MDRQLAVKKMNNPDYRSNKNTMKKMISLNNIK